VERATGIEPA